MVLFFVSADIDEDDGSEFGEDFSKIALSLAIGDLHF